MALTATISTFDIALSDVDRHVYEQLSLKVAQHPSETDEYVWTRVLAYCLEYREGIAFSKGGISNAEEPAITVRDLTGSLTHWIEVGAPDAARLHKASKASPRVAIYTHREPRVLLKGYEGSHIHKAETVELYAFDKSFIESLVGRSDRRVGCTLSITERQLYLEIGGKTLQGGVERHALPS